MAGPIRKTIRCRRNGTPLRNCENGPICDRAPTRLARWHGCGTRSRCRSTRSFRKMDSCTFTRRSSRPVTVKEPGNCFVSRRSIWTICRARTARSTLPAISSTGRAFLTVSGQLEAEIFATALGKVYTFGPTFRAENSNTSRHLAEFWMVEPEMAFFDLFDNMDLAERFLKRIIHDVLEHCLEDMTFFNQRIDKTVIETLQKIAESDFVRLPYTEAVDILQQSGVDVRVPCGVGQRPAVGARAVSDGEEIRRAGDPVRLSRYDQTVLHARQRRPTDRACHGCAGAQGR